MAGVSRQQYKTYTKYIRVMCSGRVDLGFIFRALSNGADGVFIGGCHLNDCHYNTHGNYHALNMVLLVKKILGHIGLNPERLRLESVSAGEGMRFAEIANEFGTEVKGLGPLGTGEGIDKKVLKLRLQAVSQLVPYIRVVLNERLGVRFNTVEEYQEFYAREECDRLFRDLIADKLAMSQIMLLLREGPLSTAEISKVLGLAPSEIARHLNSSAKHGLRTEAMDNAAIDHIIDKHGGEARQLIQILMEIQEENRWLPREVLKTVSEKLNVPLRQVLRIATMYKTFSLVPPKR